MVLRDQVEIRRSPREVWTWIEDPMRTPSWNPRVKAVKPAGWGARGPGYRYYAVYELRGKVSEMQAEIEEYRPPLRLSIRLTGGRLPPGAAARETYDLFAVECGTRLVQTVTVAEGGIPFLFRALIWIIQRFGRPTGKTFLTTLKELIEGQT